MPILLFMISLWLWSRLAFAGVEQISEKEFRDLAAELAPKVNLFRAGWEQDPQAEFYGGTTRDYLYWLKGQFMGAKSPAEAEAIKKKLRTLPMIDVREFIIGDSDIDIISPKGGALDAKDFGVRKIDFQPTDILNPTTTLGQNEILQGYIPAEKIRLSREGIRASTLGDGVKEIYEGKLSVHFASAEDFAKSKYAAEGINHPVLLAIRYIRLQAINYFRTHGPGYPDAEKLLASMDSHSLNQAKKLIQRTTTSGELSPFLEKKKFKSWINGAIQKSFRSYTNPTAALHLMREFGVAQLSARYPEDIEPLNQYVFAQFRDVSAVERNMKAHGVDGARFFADRQEFFPNGKLYHGTRSEEAFRGILFQGILPSEDGSAHAGLYGVAEKDKSFSEAWGGSKDRLIEFEVRPSAKIVDVTKGEGLRVWKATEHLHKNNYDEFALLFGVDIIRYPYSTQAFVVKNSEALSAPKGVYRTVMTLTDLIEKAKSIESLPELAKLLSVNALSKPEQELLLDVTPITSEQAIRYLKRAKPNLKTAELILSLPRWANHADTNDLLRKWIEGNDADLASLAKNMILSEKNPPHERLKMIDDLLALPEIQKSDTSSVLLAALRNHRAPMPNAIRISADGLEAVGKDPGKSSRLWNHSSYLSAVASHLEKESLDKILSSLKALKHSFLRIHLAKPLLENGYKPKSVKKELIKSLKQPGEAVETAALILKLLGKYLPNDPDLENLSYDYFRENLPEILQDKRNTEWVGLIKQDLRAKKALVDLLDGRRADNENVLNLLRHFDLTDTEWARFLDSVSFSSSFSSNTLPTLVDEREGKLEREGAYAIIRAYLRTDDSPNGIRENLRNALKRYPHPGELQDYVKNILSTEQLFVEGWKTDPKQGEIRKALELIGSGAVPLSPDLQEAGLSALERPRPVNSGRHMAREFLNALPLEEPGVAARVASLMADGKVYLEASERAAILARFPRNLACSATYAELGR